MAHVFYFLSAIAFALSAAVNLLALFGVDAEPFFPHIWLLHLGIFFIGIPAMMLGPASSDAFRVSGWSSTVFSCWLCGSRLSSEPPCASESLVMETGRHRL
jgi:hypothetical protein